jgi:hypothetical protein
MSRDGHPSGFGWRAIRKPRGVGCRDGKVASTSKFLPATLSSYVAVADERTARALELYFKSGSGKAFAKKRFLAAPI